MTAEIRRYGYSASYSSGSQVTFQPGCTIKYKNDAYLLLYGKTISFPPTGQMMPVFTSRNDNNFGEVIQGVPGEADSNGDPNLHKAAQAIWIYYTDYSTEIGNARIRWAKIGIQNDRNAGQTAELTVRDCLFEHITGTGSAGIAGDQSLLTPINLRKCDVTNPGAPMTDDCGPLYTVANFAGISQQQLGSGLPDTMGTVGPNHFMAVFNDGVESVAVYDKYAGIQRSPAMISLNDFFSFTVVSGPYAGTYPTHGPFDPRIVFDHASQRWIATVIDRGSEHVLLAVSHGPDPVGNGGSTWISDNWTMYLVPVGGSCQSHYDTLGVDTNGIYICVQKSDSGCNGFARVAALPKGPFIDGSAGQVQANFIIDVQDFGGPPIQPAVNFDPITAADPAWFTFEIGTNLYYNRLKWVNGFAAPPEWQDNPWGRLPVSQSFYDLVNGAIMAPQSVGTGRVNLSRQGSVLMMAMVRNINGIQYLWTCRQIGVNSVGNNENPPTGTGPADRSAVEWFKIQTTPTVIISTSGRIYDSATTNPKFYYIPSLAVNKNGDMVVGFSGSSASDYIGAFYTGKLNNGSSPSAPIRYFAGKDWFLGAAGIFFWGDYSYTSLDPDGLTIWTIQEYAETRYECPFGLCEFGTRIAAITPF